MVQKTQAGFGHLLEWNPIRLVMAFFYQYWFCAMGHHVEAVTGSACVFLKNDYVISVSRSVVS